MKKSLKIHQNPPKLRKLEKPPLLELPFASLKNRQFTPMVSKIMEMRTSRNYTICFITKKGRPSASERSERLRLSCLGNRENGGLPHFFAILVVFWDECCGGQNTLIKILKLRILTANSLVQLVYEFQSFPHIFPKKIIKSNNI